MRRRLAILGTLIFMGGMLWMGLRKPDTPALVISKADLEDIQPEPARRAISDRIESLLDVAKRGDVAAYLAMFEGPLRARLGRIVEERGRDTFAADLRNTAEARKSHATFEPEPDGDAPSSARIIVESTFTDRIERQIYRLVRRDSVWFIRDVETARDHVPGKTLGSLATFEEPEGVPVASDPTTDPEAAGEN